MISSEALTLRAAEPADAARIAELLTDEGYPVGPTDIAARIARFGGPDSAVTVAEQAGEAIGFIALQAVPRFEHDDRFVRVLAVIVDAGARERGVGHRLMAEAETFGRERGAAFVEITAGHHRPEARQLYESLGYDGAVTAYLRKRIE
ncbi:MAG: GNAT family N-acetyltransferase [Chloroflexi bacterium]|nr:GNAT family N-acetyltransferase [Chloroflexota bacterium]